MTTPYFPNWRSSSFCAAGDCAQVAKDEHGNILMRNTSSPDYVLTLSQTEFRHFVDGVLAGDFADLIEPES